MVATVKLNLGNLQECSKNPHISGISIAPELIGNYRFKKLEFDGICLKQDSVSFHHKSVVNL